VYAQNWNLTDFTQVSCSCSKVLHRKPPFINGLSVVVSTKPDLLCSLYLDIIHAYNILTYDYSI
jgi:hypothetical protein